MAVAVLAQGFSHGRSITHPYLPERIGRIWVTRDAPRANPVKYRREEWFAFGVPPTQVVATATRHTRGRFAICAIRSVSEDEVLLRAEYKRLGLRLVTTEPIFIHRLGRLPSQRPPVEILRVASEDQAAVLARAAGRRQMAPGDWLPGAKIRQYIAVENEEIVGWVRSVAVGAMTWCANLHVEPSHRRRGIGRAMMNRMLRDDQRHGVTANVLASSHTGAMLYPKVGYEQIAELFMYTPVRGGAE